MKPLQRLFVCLGTLGASVLGALAVVGLRPSGPEADAAAPPVVTIATAVPAQAGFGTIKGRLVWGGSSAPKAPVVVAKGDAAKKDAAYCTAKGAIESQELVVDPATKGVEYGLAYVSAPKGKNPAAEKALVAKESKVEIDQKHCQFIPHVTALYKGQSVVFKSSDPVPHNVHYSGFVGSGLNQSLPPNGQLEVKMTPDTRPYNLVCDIHTWMNGKIMVLDHPFFAVTKKDGSFEIKGVPAGTQSLIVWQEKVGYVTPNARKGKAVEVKADGTTDVGDIVLDPSKVK